MNCQYLDCNDKAEFATFKLLNNHPIKGRFEKRWGHFCDFHEKLIVIANDNLKEKYQNKIWSEVK